MNKKTATWIIFGVLSALCFIVFRYYLVCKNSYYFWDIYSDGYYGGYPLFCNMADAIAAHGYPSWSFRAGMGQNVFPFAFRDPFDIILYIFGTGKIVYLTIYVEAAKLIIAGVLFYRYLRLLNLSFYTSMIGCALFAFCGFIIEGSAWFSFSYEAFNFALLLLAFELLFTQKKWFLFPVAVFFICISMVFNLYLYGLFLFLYAILRNLQSGAFDIKKFSILLLKMFALGLLGILISGPFFIQNILMLLHSPRVATSALRNVYADIPVTQIDTFQIGTAILRFFSNDIMGSGSDFKGWDTIVGAPLFYCGTICLLLIPQLFSFLSKRLRIVFTLFILILLLPTVFPYLRRAIWLFTGDYYRGYSFFISFLVLFYALQAMEYIFQKQKINYTILFSTLLVLIGLLIFHPFVTKTQIDTTIRTYVICMLVVNTIILSLLPKVKKNWVIRALLLIAVFFELCVSGDVSVNKRNSFSIRWLRGKVLYNSYALDAVKYLKKTDPSFYRIDKNFDPPTARYTDLNSSQAQGYYGTSCYASFNQVYYIRYLQLMGVIDKNNEAESRWAIGLIDNPILESENNVKYFLSVKDYHPAWNQIWDSLTTIGDVTIYKNKFAIPFGYTYDQYITDSNFNIASPLQRKHISLTAFEIKNSDVSKVNGLKEFKLSDTAKEELNYETFKKEFDNKRDTLAMTCIEETKMSGTINLDANKLVYLSIPYDEGWHAIVDGKEQNKLIVDDGMTGLYLTKGAHKIELVYKLPYMLAGFIMTIAGLVILVAGYWSFRKKAKPLPTLSAP